MSTTVASFEMEVPLERYLEHLRKRDRKPLMKLAEGLIEGLDPLQIPCYVVAVGSSARIKADASGRPKYNDIDLRVLGDNPPKEDNFDFDDTVRDILKVMGYRVQNKSKPHPWSAEPGLDGIFTNYPIEYLATTLKPGLSGISSGRRRTGVDIMTYGLENGDNAQRFFSYHNSSQRPFCILASSYVASN